jgi:hypothetical protein
VQPILAKLSRLVKLKWIEEATRCRWEEDGEECERLLSPEKRDGLQSRYGTGAALGRQKALFYHFAAHFYTYCVKQNEAL